MKVHRPRGTLAALLLILSFTGCAHVHGPVVIPATDAPAELRKVLLPPYIIEPPDILLVEAIGIPPDQPVAGQHLVRPDGTIGLGIYGSVPVAGLMIDEATEMVRRQLLLRSKNPEELGKVLQVSVDVLAYNSKVYYVITDRVGSGVVVERLPITGSETVLDALGQLKGLPPEASRKHIWVARRNCQSQADQILPVDWNAIAKRGRTETNYQILPGDRIYVKAEAIQTVDNFLRKILSPIERLFGASLLGSQTVNSIRSGSTFGGVGGR